MDPAKAVPATIGALIGGILGALAWGAVAHFVHLEIGWLAWGIGIIVGAGAGMLGGRGTTMGALCAIIAAGSICGGKLFAVQLMLPNIEEEISAVLTSDSYNESMRDAADFVSVNGDDQIREFMVSHAFTDAPTGQDVSAEELDWFKTEQIPYLQEIQNTKPTFEQWKADESVALADYFRSSMSYTEALKQSLGFMDILFFLLGIGTAFKVGTGKE